jgi:HSP20 family molecular chaperone IbpA
MSLFTTLIPSLTRETARRETGAAPESGPVVKPVYEIKETDEAYGLTVLLPGVAKEGLELTAEANELRVVGRPAWQQPAGWTAVYRESANVPFELVLTHDNTIDAEKIVAELKDGVLRASLPKAAALKPRRIAVN